jgi:hypothetical protein
MEVSNETTGLLFCHVIVCDIVCYNAVVERHNEWRFLYNHILSVALWIFPVVDMARYAQTARRR